MKKVLVFCFSITVAAVQAQDVKPFKVNVSVGYAVATSSGASGGGLVGIEPKYAVSPRLDIGLRIEQAFLVRGIAGDATTKVAMGTAAAFGSYLITANHYFGTSTVRPFVGLGVGMFSIASGGTVSTIRNQVATSLPLTSYNTPGGLLRVGIKTGHFVASVDYNAIPTHTYTLSSEEFTTSSSYVGFRIGVDIGGGRYRVK